MRVLIIDYCDKVLIDRLESNGFICLYEHNINEHKLLEEIKDFEGIVFHSKISFSKSLIDKANKLKFIGRLGPTMGTIDKDYAKTKGIICFDAPEAMCDSVAEHAIGMLLNLFNNLCRANMQVKNGIWKREANRGIEIKGKTLGILGYGNTGKALAKKLSGFELKVLAYDKYIKGYEDGYCTESNMEDIYEQCDVLSLHLPLTEETNNLVDYHFIKKFKKDIYLINTSRGQIVKTEDLAKLILKGKVLGAALDVLEFEKQSFEKLHFSNMPESLQYLIDSDNIILSPHIAGWTKESEYKTAVFLAEKIVKTFRDQ